MFAARVTEKQQHPGTTAASARQAAPPGARASWLEPDQLLQRQLGNSHLAALDNAPGRPSLADDASPKAVPHGLRERHADPRAREKDYQLPSHDGLGRPVTLSATGRTVHAGPPAGLGGQVSEPCDARWLVVD